ncbi:hypothetical protein [Streptomyces sp. NPDC056682]|uniref:hypothetical protein n=1 Tax=Streptomyces sp. NPDC056682 TaxID=3345909 RepID=UPI0036BF75F3
MSVFSFLANPFTVTAIMVTVPVAMGAIGDQTAQKSKQRSYETLLFACQRRLETPQSPLDLGRIAQQLFLIGDRWPPLRLQALGLLMSEQFLAGEAPTILAARARNHDAAMRLARVSHKRAKVRRTLFVAAAIAGRSRTHLREEWAAVLAGDPDSGLALTSRQRLCLVVGFLVAALRFRLRDAVRPLWVPLDWVLSVQSRTETSIALIVGAQVIYVAWTDGVHTLLTYGWGWCGACGGALYVLSNWLRRVRGIELAAVRSSGDE